MIEVFQLSKRFGAKHVVRELSFQVCKGEVLGFLGPNGAGKSTTMRMITGYLPPDAGRVSVCGMDVTKAPLHAKAALGYLPENAPLYHEMTVRGFLEFAAAVRGMRGKEKARAVQRACELCALDPVLHEPIETLSKGYRHRTGLAQAILHDPPVLVLDEPTDGLDPNQKRYARALIREMGQTKAILLSTHVLEELEAVCTRAIVIHQGRMVADGTPAQLKSRAPGAGKITIRFAPDSPFPTQDVMDKLRSLQGVKDVVVAEAHCLQLVPRDGVDSGSLSAEALTLCLQAGFRVVEARTCEGSLDELFRVLTTNE
jgi:ABC-2 type transport system ATP-binding protein